jgi:hypothetical protein
MQQSVQVSLSLEIWTEKCTGEKGEVTGNCRGDQTNDGGIDCLENDEGSTVELAIPPSQPVHPQLVDSEPRNTYARSLHAELSKHRCCMRQ